MEQLRIHDFSIYSIECTVPACLPACLHEAIFALNFLELFYFIVDTNNFNYYIEHNEIMNASVLLITYQVFS